MCGRDRSEIAVIVLGYSALRRLLCPASYDLMSGWRNGKFTLLMQGPYSATIPVRIETYITNLVQPSGYRGTSFA